MDDLDVVVAFEDEVEGRQQRLVEFDGHHAANGLGQMSCQAAQPRPDLQHNIICGKLCRGDNFRQRGFIHQEILAEAFLRLEVEPAQEAGEMEGPQSKWQVASGK